MVDFKVLARILVAINLVGAGLVYFGIRRAYSGALWYKVWFAAGFAAIFFSWAWFLQQLRAEDVVQAYGAALLGTIVAAKTMAMKVRATLSSTAWFTTRENI
jgi:hypothetical protein